MGFVCVSMCRIRTSSPARTSAVNVSTHRNGAMAASWIAPGPAPDLATSLAIASPQIRAPNVVSGTAGWKTGLRKISVSTARASAKPATADTMERCAQKSVLQIVMIQLKGTALAWGAATSAKRVTMESTVRISVQMLVHSA